MQKKKKQKCGIKKENFAGIIQKEQKPQNKGEKKVTILAFLAIR